MTSVELHSGVMRGHDFDFVPQPHVKSAPGIPLRLPEVLYSAQELHSTNLGLLSFLSAVESTDFSILRAK